MKDFTQIKLINSLIDVVAKFYELKDSGDLKESYRLKGFCEGLAFALLSEGALSEDEVQKILKGLGKKIESDVESLNEIKSESNISDVEPKNDSDIENIEMEFEPKSLHEVTLKAPKSYDDLDIPTFLRKKL
jgi:hypothetical protein